ncbi:MULTISPECIES: phosphotransferase [Paenibacillus]|uniref:Phosphotransferase n=1 Tax=Paenibacillus xylanilyticus TaxID=248903 RepID=A0A7Y6C3A5_9BACL|nr:phosphotransferase [Paenibacillus xylanilyticus]NUU79799.1 phosphotransferase [Paenibacillus xylanilyticus]
MSDIQYNLNFEKICDQLHLGELISTPKPISGGHLHRMYVMETRKDKYAIKALNPQIMTRPEAMQNYINSERIANVAANHIPGQPANRINNSSIHNIDNQFYLIFDWIDGRSLDHSEVTNVHCDLMGTILADIHKINFSQLNVDKTQIDYSKDTDWAFYLDKGKEESLEWYELLDSTIQQLYEWSAKAKRSSLLLTSDAVISHRDLEPKNVMWKRNNPIIIDWESAGYINPMHDLVETAIYWSINSTGNIDKGRFLAFINGYRKHVSRLSANWRLVLENGLIGKLNWLEYSLKRSLWIECTDQDEQRMGTAQVTWTIKALKQYDSIIPEVESWMDI